jgi:hypothetical protein
MSNRRKVRTHAGWTALAGHLETVLSQVGRAQLDSIVEAASPGLNDQMQAAVAEAMAARTRGIATAERIDPGHYGEVVSDATARAQLYGHFLRVITGLAAGTVPHCPHISLTAPRPAIVVVFAPSIDCHACYRRRPRPRLSDVEEHTCDLCRGYVPGQTIHCVLPQCGPYMLVAGMCDRCRDRLESGS